jgi:hypothetical protein
MDITEGVVEVAWAHEVLRLLEKKVEKGEMHMLGFYCSSSRDVFTFLGFFAVAPYEFISCFIFLGFTLYNQVAFPRFSFGLLPLTDYIVLKDKRTNWNIGLKTTQN